MDRPVAFSGPCRATLPPVGIVQSPARISFFKQVIDAAPATGGPLKEKHRWGIEGEYYLVYFCDHQPAAHVMTLPQGVRFKAEVIDTWEMTVP
jgi:hypothetical protein